MKKQLLLFAISMATVMGYAQTTHTIIWEMGISSTDASLTIDVGDTIEWEWGEAVPHTVESSDPDAPATFGSGTLSQLGDVYSFTFTDVAVFDYACGIHPSMAGTITVQPVTVTYCTPVFTDGCAFGDTLDDVTITDADSNTVLEHLATGCATGDFGDYTSNSNLEIEVDAGESYDFEISHGYEDQWVGIWIDFDGNGSFEDSDEEVYMATSGTATDTSPTSGSFNIPSDADATTTRLRIMTSYSNAPADSCTPGGIGFSYGETHDYTIIINAEEVCEAPTNLEITAVSDTSVNFSWEAAPVTNNIEGYGWRIMYEGDDPITDTPVAENMTEFFTAAETGLEADTTYDLYLVSVCDLVSEFFSDFLMETFTTDKFCSPVSECQNDDVILHVSFEGIENTSECTFGGYADYTTETPAMVNAGEVYEIGVTVGGGLTGTDEQSVSVWIDYNDNGVFEVDEFTYIGTDTDTTISGDIEIPTDAAEGTFRMRVRVAAVPEQDATWDMACDPATQVYGETEDYMVEVGALGLDSNTIAGLRYYPNPAGETLTIAAPEKITSLTLYSLLGQKVLYEEVNHNENTISLSGLASGVYMMKVIAGDQQGVYRILKN